MDRATIAYLISDSPVSHGVYSAPVTTERMVYCIRKSVTRSEAYSAMGIGLSPSFVIKLSDYAEYNNEKLVKVDNVTYKVIRTYETGDCGIELTLQRSDD